MLTFPDIQRMVWAGDITYAQAMALPEANEHFLLNSMVSTREEFDALATRQHVTDPVRARIVRLARSGLFGLTSRDIRVVLGGRPDLTEPELVDLASTLGMCIPWAVDAPETDAEFQSAVTALVAHPSATDATVLAMLPMADPRAVAQTVLVDAGHPVGAAIAVLRHGPSRPLRDVPVVAEATAKIRSSCPAGTDLGLFVKIVAVTAAQFATGGSRVDLGDVLAAAAAAASPARTCAGP